MRRSHFVLRGSLQFEFAGTLYSILVSVKLKLFYGSVFVVLLNVRFRWRSKPMAGTAPISALSPPAERRGLRSFFPCAAGLSEPRFIAPQRGSGANSGKHEPLIVAARAEKSARRPAGQTKRGTHGRAGVPARGKSHKRMLRT